MIHTQFTMKQSPDQRETVFGGIKIYLISKTNLGQVRTFRCQLSVFTLLSTTQLQEGRYTVEAKSNEKLHLITSMF